MVLGGRDLLNEGDSFQGYDAELGLPLWFVEYPANGRLDYGNSPRSTPLIHGENAYLCGAFGDVHCVKLETGETVWKTKLSQFGDPGELPWGYCASPLIVDEKLILNPGGKDASLIALDAKSGELKWQSKGEAPGYGSFIAAEFGGVLQIVGHDQLSLGGWDVKTGKRLWKVIPEEDGDFNVPTPMQYQGKLLVCTENNGARLFQFKARGLIDPKPIARNDHLTPDMSSPVIVGDRVFCVNKLLFCLDLKNELKTAWRGRDTALSGYGAIIADENRLLVVGKGELLLVDAKAEKLSIVSRQQVFDDGAEVFSHPAIVGDRLYIRGENTLRCLKLK